MDVTKIVDQLLEAIDPEEFLDQQMDHLLTPARFVHFATERNGQGPLAQEKPPEDTNA